MKIKLTNLIEGVIISNPPSTFGNPSSTYTNPTQPAKQNSAPPPGIAAPTPAKPFNPAQPFGQPVIPSVPKSSGVYSPTPAPPPGIAAPTPATTTGTGSFILDNPPTTPTPQKPLPAGEAPAMLRPNFNPAQPFGQSVIPTLPLGKPGAEYSPTPGGVKPKNPTVVVNPVDTSKKEPGMSQEDMERDADKWAQKPAPTTDTPAPAPTQTEKPKRKSQEEVNREYSERTHARTLETQQRKAEKARAVTAANQAEAEKRESEYALIRGPGRGGRGGRASSRVFEQYNLQFKPGALNSLLQEGGIADAASAAWNATKQFGKDVSNRGVVKGIENLTGTEYFTKGAIHPNIAAREFVRKLTKETPGEPTLNLLKNLTRYSPQTFARMQAGRYARAAAFTPEEAEEKISHYARMAALTNPLNYGGALASGIGSALSSRATKSALTATGSAIGGPVGSAIGTGVGQLAGIAGSVVGGVGKAAQKIATPYLAQQARETGKLIAARKDDWRYAAL